MTSPIISNAVTLTLDEGSYAVRLSDVSVRFRVPTERVNTLKERVIRTVRGHRAEYQEFWALRDFTLEIPRGETLGLVGRNGAGKSTLLKVIARVLSPTNGRVQIRGAIAPLIELGTGFHPELTGRENIFLNGAMLGFPRAAMEEKFDRIVEFSELAPFIDAPIRTYSSGMIVRLGFAIAVDVEPDILIVDEILAVGDLSFQQKCIARMHEFKEQGTTILFVSHSLSSIRELCDTAVWVDRGTARTVGAVDDVIEEYQDAISDRPALWTSAALPEEQTRAGTSIFVDLPGAMAEGTHWMVGPIETAYRNGIVSECERTPLRYCPQQPLTRGELAVFLLRARSWPSPPALDSQPVATADIPDIPQALPESSRWMEPWIKQALAENIITVAWRGDEAFHPRQPVTRAELAVWLLKAKHGADYEPPPAAGVFADVPAGLNPDELWMAPWIEQIYREGITSGCAQHPLRYCPQREVTRADIAVFLLRAFDIT